MVNTFGSKSLKRKRIGETEQDVIRRQAQEKQARMDKATAEGRVEGQVTDASGRIIRTPEQQKEFTERAKEFKGEEEKARSFTGRAAEFQALADPKRAAEIKAIENAPAPDFDIPSQKDRFPGQISTTPVVAQAEALAQAEIDQKLIKKISRGEATPEEIRAATGRFNLNEVDLAVIKSGDVNTGFINSKIDVLGAFLPRQVKKWIPLFSTPSKEVEENIDLLKQTKDNLFLNYESIKNGVSVEDNLRQIREKEQAILRYESIIKIMTIQSGALQSNPEQIDSINLEVNGILTGIALKRKEYAQFGINI